MGAGKAHTRQPAHSQWVLLLQEIHEAIDAQVHLTFDYLALTSSAAVIAGSGVLWLASTHRTLNQNTVVLSQARGSSRIAVCWLSPGWHHKRAHESKLSDLVLSSACSSAR